MYIGPDRRAQDPGASPPRTPSLAGSLGADRTQLAGGRLPRRAVGRQPAAGCAARRLWRSQYGGVLRRARPDGRLPDAPCACHYGGLRAAGHRHRWCLADHPYPQRHAALELRCGARRPRHHRRPVVRTRAPERSQRRRSPFSLSRHPPCGGLSMGRWKYPSGQAQIQTRLPARSESVQCEGACARVDDAPTGGDRCREPRLGLLARDRDVDVHRVSQGLGGVDLLHPDRRPVAKGIDGVVIGHLGA